MEWIKNHYIDVFAVVGALYAAARIVVAWTPTKKDDKALSKIGVWIKAIAKLFGLEFDDGNKTED